MSYGDQLKKARLAAGLTVEQFAAQVRTEKGKGVSPRLVAYWEADEKLPPRERDALTRERLLAWAQSLARPPGPSNIKDQTRGASDSHTQSGVHPRCL